MCRHTVCVTQHEHAIINSISYFDCIVSLKVAMRAGLRAFWHDAAGFGSTLADLPHGSPIVHKVSLQDDNRYGTGTYTCELHRTHIYLASQEYCNQQNPLKLRLAAVEHKGVNFPLTDL